MTVAQSVRGQVNWPEFAGARILLVDDDADTLVLLSRALRRSGCTDLFLAGEADEALSLYETHKPDLVVMDLQLPGSDGLRLMDQMRGTDPDSDEALVLMVTGNESERVKWEALEQGVSDFLPKSADTTEFVLRVRNLLHLRGLKREIDKYQQSLEATVRQRTLELEAARREVLERLARAAEYRDDATGEHTRRVGKLSALIAEQLDVSPTYAETIGNAALLHDLGKIGIPDTILQKPGTLTFEEFETIKAHPEIGAGILEGCNEPLLQMARDIALTHHERWDGSGYPNGLARDSIPLCGRIVAVADAFDAITHERPYKPALPAAMAVTMITAERSRHFDPEVVDAFMAVVSTDIHDKTTA